MAPAAGGGGDHHSDREDREHGGPRAGRGLGPEGMQRGGIEPGVPGDRDGTVPRRLDGVNAGVGAGAGGVGVHERDRERERHREQGQHGEAGGDASRPPRVRSARGSSTRPRASIAMEKP